MCTGWGAKVSIRQTTIDPVERSEQILECCVVQTDLIVIINDDYDNNTNNYSYNNKNNNSNNDNNKLK